MLKLLKNDVVVVDCCFQSIVAQTAVVQAVCYLNCSETLSAFLVLFGNIYVF